jgi:predicted ATPase/DNA-binding SARP family transcriptional activator
VPRAAALRGLPTPPRPSSPPTPLTSLVGRGRELDDLELLLASRRLVTLTGPGGAGKTRLALEIARRSSGVVAWAELAPIADPSLIAHQVLTALGGRSGGQSLAIESVIELLGADRCLLVLDNCEHLIEACALFARAILHGCPTTSILATSREGLGVAGEHIWPVPPLSLPEPEARRVGGVPGTSEAVALFVERARAVAPRFELDDRNAAAVAEICRRVDGLPLALELAAARVRALTPEEIARRIAASFKLLASGDRAVDPRHRTLDAAIDWSFELLDDPERLLLVRLSVFAGGFSIEAVERVCAGDGLERERVLDLLIALVDKSLVLAPGMVNTIPSLAMPPAERPRTGAGSPGVVCTTPGSLGAFGAADGASPVRYTDGLPEPFGGECRYRLLESVRHYGAERLEPAAAAALRERHARVFLELAEAAEPHIFGGAAHETWMRRLEAELANLRAAIEWGLEDPERVEVALRLGASLHWFWFARGRLREGNRVLARALATSAGADQKARAHASIALGQVAIWQGDHEAVRPAMEEGVSLLGDASGDDFWRAYARCGLGIARTMDGEMAGTLSLIDEAVATARRFDRTVLLPFALYWRARVLGAIGELRRGIEDAEEGVVVSRRIGHRPGVAHCLDVGGSLLLASGDAQRAAERLGESFAIHRDNGDLWGLSRVLESLARLALRQDRPQHAIVFHAAAERIRQSIGSPVVAAERVVVDAAIAVCRDRLGVAELERTWSTGSGLDLTELAAVVAESAALATPGAAVASEAGTSGRVERPPRPPAEAARPAPVPAQPPESSRVLEIRALGAGEAWLEGAVVQGLWGRPKELLVLLAWHSDGLRREDVGLALWPDAAPEKLRNLFHVTLHRLRKCMGARDWVVREGERYRLSGAISWELDARRFETAATAALRDLRKGVGIAGAAPLPGDSPRPGLDDATVLSDALALYRGDFLEGESAGEWHYDVKERLRELWLEATRELARTLVERGRDGEAAAAFRSLLARDPVDEEASRALMACALRRGERGEALREYRRLERALRDELGVEPGPEVAALYKQVRRGGGAA